MQVYMVNLIVVLTLGLFQSVKSSQPEMDTTWKESEKAEGLYLKAIPPKKGDRLPGMVTLFLSYIEPGDALFGLFFSYHHYYRGGDCNIPLRKIDLYLDDKKVDFKETCEIMDNGAAKRSIYPTSISSFEQVLNILKKGGDTVKLKMFDLSLDLPSSTVISNLKQRYHPLVNQSVINVGWTLEAGGIEWVTLLLGEDVTPRTLNLKFLFKEDNKGMVLAVSRSEGDRCLEQDTIRIAEIDETPVRLKRLCSEYGDRYLYKFYTDAGEKYFLDLLLNKKEPIDFRLGFRMLIPSKGFSELYSRYKRAL